MTKDNSLSFETCNKLAGLLDVYGSIIHFEICGNFRGLWIDKQLVSKGEDLNVFLGEFTSYFWDYLGLAICNDPNE